MHFLVNYNFIIVSYFLSIGVMDLLDIFQVRFHFGGQFDYDGFTVNYVGGSVGMSFIERDRLFFFENVHWHVLL